MDPNQTLDKLGTALNWYWKGKAEENPWVMDSIAELITDLDEWLRGGGFLPEAWAPKQTEV